MEAIIYVFFLSLSAALSGGGAAPDAAPGPQASTMTPAAPEAAEQSDDNFAASNGAGEAGEAEEAGQTEMASASESGQASGADGDASAATAPAQAPTQTAAVVAPAFTAEPQVPTGKFTVAAEIKPLLGVTKPQWIMIRPSGGQDLLYFTNLLAWRCGMHQIRFSINGGDLQPLNMEPCYVDEPAPNTLKVVGTALPFLAFPENSIQSVHVEILFDDMTTDGADYQRMAILRP